MTTDLPPICATVEDVRRAAPVAGFYPINLGFGWRPYELHISTVRPSAGDRYWTNGASACWPDDDFIDARIGPRIVMPGEVP